MCFQARISTLRTMLWQEEQTILGPTTNLAVKFPVSSPGAKRSPTRPTWTPVISGTFLTRTRLYIPVLVIHLAPRTAAFQSFSRESHKRIEEQIIGYACKNCAPYSRPCTSVSSNQTSGKIQPSGRRGVRMALQYGRHTLSVYTKVPGRASGRFLTNGCCACGWPHVQLRRSAMHAFAFAMCAIRTPAKTWGQGGQRAGEAKRHAESPHRPNLGPGVDPVLGGDGPRAEPEQQ
jgi:hypothetical protein